MPSRARRSSSPSSPATVVDAEPGLDDVVAGAAGDVVVAVVAAELVGAAARRDHVVAVSPHASAPPAVVSLSAPGPPSSVVGMSTATVAVSSRSPRSRRSAARRRPGRTSG